MASQEHLSRFRKIRWDPKGQAPRPDSHLSWRCRSFLWLDGGTGYELKIVGESPIHRCRRGMDLVGGLGQHSGKTGPKYDKANEVQIPGVIEDVREVPGEFEGVDLVVKAETKTVLVHVAPSEFLKEIDTSFNKGDQVVGVGAKAPGAPEEEMLARAINDGNK